jgi:hypothetical protein
MRYFLFTKILKPPSGKIWGSRQYFWVTVLEYKSWTKRDAAQTIFTYRQL